MKYLKILITIFCVSLLFGCAAPQELSNPFDEASANYINLNDFADYMLPPNNAAYTWLKPTIQFGYLYKKVDGYRIYFSEDENFSENATTVYDVVSFGGSIANVTFDKADKINTDYWWKYQVKWNGFYFEDHSAPAKFRIRNFFLKYPSTAGSDELDKIYYYNSDFEWENMRNNAGFDLEISQDVNFADQTTIRIDVSSDYTKPYEVQYTLQSTSDYKITYRSEFPLTPNAEYYWRCKLKNETEWALKLGSADQRYERFQTYVIEPFLYGITDDDELKRFTLGIDAKDGEGNELKNNPRFNIKIYHKTEAGNEIQDLYFGGLVFPDLKNIRYDINWSDYQSKLLQDGTVYYVGIQAEEQVNGIWYPSGWSHEYYNFTVPQEW